MSKKPPLISVVIPVEKNSPKLENALRAYAKQSYSNFELFVSSSEAFASKYDFAAVIENKKLRNDPASKRNEIIKYANGEILVFNDDDVATPPEYLRNIAEIMEDKAFIGAAGPLIVPSDRTSRQSATAAVWESNLGMGALGGGMHLSRKLPARTVFDQPAANLILRREVFASVDGFEPGLYPGEDTKLCLLIYNRFKKGLRYDPKLFVYHNRASLFRPHLSKISRYGAQRGRFSLAYPETSRKPLYFIPSLFLLYLLALPFLVLFLHGIFILPLLLYSILLLLEYINVSRRHSFRTGGLTAAGIVATHIWYGFSFLTSFIGKILQWMRRYL